MRPIAVRRRFDVTFWVAERRYTEVLDAVADLDGWLEVTPPEVELL